MSRRSKEVGPFEPGSILNTVGGGSCETLGLLRGGERLIVQKVGLLHLGG